MKRDGLIGGCHPTITRSPVQPASARGITPNRPATDRTKQLSNALRPPSPRPKKHYAVVTHTVEDTRERWDRRGGAVRASSACQTAGELIIVSSGLKPQCPNGNSRDSCTAVLRYGSKLGSTPRGTPLQAPPDGTESEPWAAGQVCNRVCNPQPWLPLAGPCARRVCS